MTKQNERYTDIITLLDAIKEELKSNTLAIDLLDTIQLILEIKQGLLEEDGFFNSDETVESSKIFLLNNLRTLEYHLEEYEIQSENRDSLVEYIKENIKTL